VLRAAKVAQGWFVRIPMPTCFFCESLPTAERNNHIGGESIAQEKICRNYVRLGLSLTMAVLIFGATSVRRPRGLKD
jgi:hypothetical protein